MEELTPRWGWGDDRSISSYWLRGGSQEAVLDKRFSVSSLPALSGHQTLPTFHFLCSHAVNKVANYLVQTPPPTSDPLNYRMLGGFHFSP